MYRQKIKKACNIIFVLTGVVFIAIAVILLLFMYFSRNYYENNGKKV